MCWQIMADSLWVIIEPEHSLFGTHTHKKKWNATSHPPSDSERECLLFFAMPLCSYVLEVLGPEWWVLLSRSIINFPLNWKLWLIPCHIGIFIIFIQKVKSWIHALGGVTDTDYWQGRSWMVSPCWRSGRACLDWRMIFRVLLGVNN